VTTIKLIIAITGASGTILGIRILEELKKANIETHAIISGSAKIVSEHEQPSDININHAPATKHYKETDIAAPIASGSYKTDGMIIAPCSMKTLSAIANSYTDNLITRAADVCLRYKRKLIIIPRETPLNSIHLENMLKLSKAGAWILPPNLSYYHNPKTLDDMTDFIVGKALDCFEINHNLYKRWGD